MRGQMAQVTRPATLSLVNWLAQQIHKDDTEALEKVHDQEMCGLHAQNEILAHQLNDSRQQQHAAQQHLADVQTELAQALTSLQVSAA